MESSLIIKKEGLIGKEITLYTKGFRAMFDGEKPRFPTNYFFLPGNPGERISVKDVAQIIGVNPGTIQLVHKYYLLNEHLQGIKNLEEKIITKRQLTKIDISIAKETRKIITNFLYPLKIRWVRELGNDVKPFYVLGHLASQPLPEKEVLKIRKNCKIGKRLSKNALKGVK
jgi:hypothetical protein